MTMFPTGNKWCILRTSGPSTLRLTASLQAAGFAAWTPTEHIRRRVPRGKTTEHRIAPMAPTYVFVRGDHVGDLRKIERADITPHPRFSIFRYYGETVFIRHGELSALRSRQQTSYVASLPATGKGPCKPRGAAYAVGDAVTLTEGPLAGLNCFVEISDGLTTTLAVTLFGRTAGVKVQTLQLRAASVSQGLTAA